MYINLYKNKLENLSKIRVDPEEFYDA